jgi:hypothetical protein
MRQLAAVPNFGAIAAEDDQIKRFFGGNDEISEAKPRD